MKRIFFLFLIFICITGYSQNAVHYAFDTNGPLGECLFPQDANGNVKYSGIVEVEGTPDEIFQAVSNFLESYSTAFGFDYKKKTSTPKAVIYEIKCPVGKEIREFDVWSIPVYAFMKDASEVVFNCKIEAITGKFKYTMTNFITKRNTIKGDAKNDGLPNIVHWQRVNSLRKERDFYASGHNINKRSTKEEVYDFNARINYEMYLYKLEHDKVESFVKALNSIKVRSDDEFESDFIEEPVSEPVIIPTLDISNYKGNLLKRGNNVYVSGENTFESAGASELIKQITIDTLWNVVPYPQMAHFIIEYRVDLAGKDHAFLTIRSRDGLQSFSGFKRGSNESPSLNRDVAKQIYLKDFYPVIEKMEQGKTPKEFQQFILK